MSGFAHRVRAILGPTNTGKTHLAIERMLAHASGIIGFPLRLLARENYDRMVARKGAKNVALITGEEKIVPPGARWFSCTAEAMPLDHAAEFVAVDEIQLCADPDRGHVFTERLLHARGLVETMFLGAETIRPLLQRMVPDAVVETRPRLSQLTYTGHVKLTRLPPRSAVVAFSAGEVYAIAEAIRRRRGGCAVVMGRLSPRTRNAQVALYQEKEVDFLVATDAIGMGLNMDVDHVAFASLTKFDGHRPRRLTAPEVAQIGGRAGRGMRDGTFGTTAECPAMPEDLVHAVEGHSFDRLTHLCWRNSDLDYSHIDRLLASLNEPPPFPGLVRGNDSSDLETLAVLSREPEIRSLASSRSRLRLLWETCQIPDFRKLADDTHTRLCARVFGHIVRDGVLPTDWLAGQIAALSRSEGDIDTLMQRLAGVRIWSYIAARDDWVPDAAHWQARARVVEDLLSDALHERLTVRFVDRRAAHLMRRLDAADGTELLSAVTRRGEVVVEGHPVGHVRGFTFIPDPQAAGEERKLVLRAARRALGKEIPRRVGVLEAAPDDAFAFADDTLSVTWDEIPVARLRPGATALKPRVEVLHTEFLDGPQRERVRLRLQRFVDEQVRLSLSPLLAAAAEGERTPGLRGLMHRLTEGMGIVSGEPAVPDALRGRLRALNVRLGAQAAFIPTLLKPRALVMRARLWSVRNGLAALPGLPAEGAVSLPAVPDWPPGFADAMGWVTAGPVLVRLDIAERIRSQLVRSTRRGPVPVPPDLASRFSVRGELLPVVLRALGFRVLPATSLAPDQYGPEQPAMLLALRKRRPHVTPRHAIDQRRAAPPDPSDGAFAVLAALRVGAG